jgi:site-specific recombinase XerC
VAKPIGLNVEHLISEVAVQHRLILKPDDAAFALVTKNRLVLEGSLEAIRARIAQDPAQFKATAQWAHSTAESAIESGVRRSARALREQIQSDIKTARLRAAEIAQEIKETHEKPMTYRDFAIKPSTVHQEFRVLRRMLNVAVRKKLLVANPCSGVEFPIRVKELFRPHYMTWSEQQKIDAAAPDFLRNVIRIIEEPGLRVYKELASMRKEGVDLANAIVWIPDSKTNRLRACPSCRGWNSLRQYRIS